MMASKLEIPAGFHSGRLAAYLHNHLIGMADALDGIWSFILDAPNSECSADLRRVVDAIVEDDRTLRELMVELGISPRFAGLGRAHDSGVVARSRPRDLDRDRLIELEHLVAGSRARAGMWACVDGLFADHPQYDGDFAWRAVRAEEEAAQLERRCLPTALSFWRGVRKAS